MRAREISGVQGTKVMRAAFRKTKSVTLSRVRLFPFGNHISDRLGDRVRFLLLHSVSGSGYGPQLSISGALGEIDLEAVPGLVDLIALLLRESRKGAAGRQVCAFENDERHVIVPLQMLLRRQKPVGPEELRIVPIRIEAGGDRRITPFLLLVSGIHENEASHFRGVSFLILADQNAASGSSDQNERLPNFGIVKEIVHVADNLAHGVSAGDRVTASGAEGIIAADPSELCNLRLNGGPCLPRTESAAGRQNHGGSTARLAFAFQKHPVAAGDRHKPCIDCRVIRNKRLRFPQNTGMDCRGSIEGSETERNAKEKSRRREGREGNQAHGAQPGASANRDHFITDDGQSGSDSKGSTLAGILQLLPEDGPHLVAVSSTQFSRMQREEPIKEPAANSKDEIHARPPALKTFFRFARARTSCWRENSAPSSRLPFGFSR